MKCILARSGVGLTLLFLVAGCGGKLGTDAADTDGGVDAVVTDEGVPEAIVPDGGPSTCGVGGCKPGASCSPDGCNTCSCVRDGEWACTLLACVDAGPPPPPPCPGTVPSGYCTSDGQVCTYPNGCGGKTIARCGGEWWSVSSEPCSSACPPVQPTVGTACLGSATCSYKNDCGGSNTAWCDGKSWHVERGPCTVPTCPSYLPKYGEPCVGPNKCAYPSGCPMPHTAVCEGTTSTWTVYWAECPPPPPPTCPTALPPSGSACSSGLNCQWDNGCGGQTYGYCSSGTWMLKPGGCVAGCPATKPPSGTPCKPIGTSACTYLVPGTSSCTSQCFCADDYRWACLTPPCATPTPPPGY